MQACRYIYVWAHVREAHAQYTQALKHTSEHSESCTHATNLNIYIHGKSTYIHAWIPRNMSICVPHATILNIYIHGKSTYIYAWMPRNMSICVPHTTNLNTCIHDKSIYIYLRVPRNMSICMETSMNIKPTHVYTYTWAQVQVHTYMRQHLSAAFCCTSHVDVQ